MEDGPGGKHIAWAAGEGCAEAQVLVGIRHEVGLGTRRNAGKAVGWYLRAAGQDEPEAWFRLGELTRDGVGMPEDPERAMLWFRLAAERGHAAAQRSLGQAYSAGTGEEEDAWAGFWLREAAEAGDADGMSLLSSWLLSGPRGGMWGRHLDESGEWEFKAHKAEADLERKVRGDGSMETQEPWTVDAKTGAQTLLAEYRVRALGGDADAAFEMARLSRYEPRNERHLVYHVTQWYWRAAELGHAEAMWNLGCAFRIGRLVPRSDFGAAFWFRASARAGYAPGMYNFGMCLEEGTGVTADLPAAQAMYRQAAGRGHLEAKDRLEGKPWPEVDM